MNLRLTTRLLVLGMIAIGGCGDSPERISTGASNSPEAKVETTIAEPISSLKAAQEALQQRRPAEAQQLISRALLEAPGDAQTLLVAAEIAYANGKMEQAVDLMADAAAADRLQDAKLVDRVTVGYVSVGRIYDAIEFLEKALERHPDRHEQRRNLFDFLVNVEEHHRAIPHGRKLVRARQFDRVLLFSLCTTEQRDMEGDSMKMLFKRNPGDPRLQLADVRIKFDAGQWSGLDETLLQILEHSPKNVAAQVLLGRVRIQTGQLDRLEDWAKRLTPEIEQTWEYWSIAGDWAYAEKRYQQAARAYWESIRRNVDIGPVLAKLAGTLSVLQSRGQAIDDTTINAISKRAELLGEFIQDKESFLKSGNRSCSAIVDMAESLVRLGRYWEAEAWTAYGMTIPDENLPQLKKTRLSVIGFLKNNAAWQATENRPVFDLDLSHHPLPELKSSSVANDAVEGSSFSVSRLPSLRNEAQQRGLGSARGTDPDKFADQGIPIYAQMEAGGCAIDFDLDGWPDLYVASANGMPSQLNSDPNRMYRNENGQFVETTDQSGCQDSGFAQGVTMGDVNSDGFDDLIVMNYGLNQLFINNGDGTFTRRNDWFPNQSLSSWSTSGAIADLDGDGISDFFCVNYCAGMQPVELQCFTDEETGKAGPPCWPTRFAAEPDSVMSGREDGGFDLADRQWNLSPETPGRGLGIVVGALDSRVGNDVFVANDMTNNHFWSAESGGQFSLNESATIKGLAFDGRFRPQACMGIAASDFDADGDIDLFVTNFEQEYNTFYENTEAGIWTDRSEARGLAESSYWTLGFGTQAIDFDNDGQDEIAITNGHVYKDNDPPASYKQKMHVLRRSESSRFELAQMSDSDAYVNQAHVGRAMWKLDADRDGRTDLAITHQTEPLALLMNRTETNANWIKVRLVGVIDSRDAIGAKVTVQQGEFQRTAALMAGNGFHCANERVLHFGLGKLIDPERPISIAVTWPGGNAQTFLAKVNREQVVVQGLAP